MSVIDLQSRDLPEKPLKESLPWPNIANTIHDWLHEAWPELVTIPYAWFTGSRIWSFLYDEPQPKDSDLDLFVESTPRPSWMDPSLVWNDEMRLSRLRQLIGPILLESPPKAKSKTSLGGYRVCTTRGKLDYWVTQSQGVIQQLQNYPSQNHGHCKAAYSVFWGSLIVLRNPCASPQGAFELAERRMLKYGAMEVK